mgnify:CR=1 FL=1
MSLTSSGVRTPLLPEQVSGFAAQLRGPVIQPGDPSYDEARAVYNAMIDKHPALIAQCADVADVIATVNLAREHGLPLAVRGGGHNGAGLGTVEGGIVLDLGLMNGIRVDPTAHTARVEGGATLGDVHHATFPFGLVTPSGIISTTGVGGITLGGGLGYLTRKFGLAIDNLLEADVVLADGTLVTASPDQHPDLFWALRGGGGGNVGVVTSFTLRTSAADDVSMASITWPWDEAAQVIAAWQEWAPHTDARLSSSLAIFRPDAGVIGFTGVLLGPVEELEALLAPMLATGAPMANVRSLSWSEAAEELAGPAIDQIAFKNGSAFAYQPLPPEAISLIISQMAVAPAPSNLISFFALGGAIGKIARS